MNVIRGLGGAAWVILSGSLCVSTAGVSTAGVAERQAFFGDLHVHTQYSFDAFVFGVRTGPDDAYRYAKGEPLPHPNGGTIRLRGAPLDFLAVTDHATYMGVVPAVVEASSPVHDRELARLLTSGRFSEVMQVHRRLTAAIVTGEGDAALNHQGVIRSTWQKIVESAERHYEPDRFTTFVGFEYTPHAGANLHRNVIFRSGFVSAEPFSALNSLNPEHLWDWMDAQRELGFEALAIPHNPNWSNGTMFARTRYDGAPLTAADAARRLRNEPLVEITQVKGTSETHPLLSQNDEWAGFELFGDKASHISGLEPDAVVQLEGSYVRSALLAGLELEAALGVNPFRLGFIGSSDTHNTGASYEETDYHGKTGINDGTPQRRGSVPAEGVASWAEMENLDPADAPTPYLINWSAAGLVGIWAERNTRESLYDALRQRETFATSGPRIRVRAFLGYDLSEEDLELDGGMASLYERAAPMGGELRGRNDEAVPVLLAWAMRDPISGWLQRIQVIKGWIEQGRPKERVFDVACSDGLRPDPRSHRCPDNGARVDLSTCEAPVESGAVELRALWRDPQFDSGQRAFYYVRVLENPSCRWSTWDALRARVEPSPQVPATIQERVWTSPIFYLPSLR